MGRVAVQGKSTPVSTWPSVTHFSWASQPQLKSRADLTVIGLPQGSVAIGPESSGEEERRYFEHSLFEAACPGEV